MTPFRRFAALAVGGLLSAVAVAQLDAAQDRVEGAAAKPVGPPGPLDTTAERSEDIEVLRRILNKSLGLPNKLTATQQNLVPLQPSGFGGFGGQPGGIGGFSGHGLGGGFSGHGLGGGGGFSGFGQPMYGSNTVYVTQPTIGPFDGVYLAGHGVVFTLKVPEQAGVTLDTPTKAVGLTETCLKCHASVSQGELEANPQAARTQSEWERAQAELRGDKPKAEQPKGPAKLTRQQICEPGNLTERLITKLWQNAKHVRHLPAAERVTVVVTFDGVAGSARNRQVLDPVSGEVHGSRPLTLTDDKGAPVPRGFTTEEAQQLTLGDLHLKQNKPKEAAHAYERALARFKEPLTKMNALAGLDEAGNRGLVTVLVPRVQDTYAKLAQAWLAAGDKDKAAAALDMSRKFTIELVIGSSPAKEKSVPVPAKLTVSVTRADLDKAGDDLTAFKKAVRVELTGFPLADKKK